MNVCDNKISPTHTNKHMFGTVDENSLCAFSGNVFF